MPTTSTEPMMPPRASSSGAGAPDADLGHELGGTFVLGPASMPPLLE